MDAFWTGDETAGRERAQSYFQAFAPDGPGPGRTPDGIWAELDGAPGEGGNPGPRPGRLAARVAMLEAAAVHSPRLGRDLLAWRAAAAPLDPLESRVLGLGRLAGTAAHVLAAGVRAARERGAFASSLMGCREVQESLAGLLTGADVVLFGACRLCRLLEKGERDRAALESSRLAGQAEALESGVRSVALALLGAPWVAANLQAPDPGADERTLP